MADEHLPALEEFKTAQDVWEHLKAYFSGKSQTRRLLLRLELNALSKASTESLASFVYRGRTLRHALNDADETRRDEDFTEAQPITCWLGCPRRTLWSALLASTSLSLSRSELSMVRMDHGRH